MRFYIGFCFQFNSLALNGPLPPTTHMCSLDAQPLSIMHVSACCAWNCSSVAASTPFCFRLFYVICYFFVVWSFSVTPLLVDSCNNCFHLHSIAIKTKTLIWITITNAPTREQRYNNNTNKKYTITTTSIKQREAAGFCFYHSHKQRFVQCNGMINHAWQLAGDFHTDFRFRNSLNYPSHVLLHGISHSTWTDISPSVTTLRYPYKNRDTGAIFTVSSTTSIVIVLHGTEFWRV